MAKPKTNKPDTSPKVYQRDKIDFDLHVRELPWTEKQQALIELGASRESRVIFLSGPAGSSKTTVAMRIGLELMQQKKVSDIVFVRAAVESADSKLGFLPGDINGKYEPYMGPFEDKLEELLPAGDVKRLKGEERLVYKPINFVRGASWTAKFIIIDECFPGYTRVLKEDGKAISIFSLYEKYKLGKELPRVVSFNEATKQFEAKQVKSASYKGSKKTVQIKAANRKINCTEEHPFLTQRGWVAAKELVSGDCLYVNDDSFQTIAALTKTQEQVVYGSYLGDGSISNHGNNRQRLRVIHGEKQRDYCTWKASLFNAELTSVSENGFSKKPAVKFASKIFALDNNEKLEKKDTCPDWLLEKLDALGVAVWFMDDGCYYTDNQSVTLHTESFNYASQEKFVNFFKTKYDIDVKIQRTAGADYEYYFLRINKGDGNALKFLNLVAPYMHESMRYKNPIVVDNAVDYFEKLSYRYVVIDSVKDSGLTEDVYDIEVEDNHNFLVVPGTRGKDCKKLTGVVAHNCQNLTINEIQTLLTRIGKFTKMILCADSAQSDLPKNKQGGFEKAAYVFNTVEAQRFGIYSVAFNNDDIMRSELCKFIVKTFEENHDSIVQSSK
jgi:phosphate starvation-inducible protein PhoH